VDLATMDIDVLRRTPAYPFAEAARYLNIPYATLRSWCVGTTYGSTGKKRLFSNVIDLDGDPQDGLSFLNLVEAHVLAALRRHHRIPLPKVRLALSYTSKHLNIARPLAHASFQTDGVDLLVEKLGSLVNVSQAGQIEMASLIRVYLKRIKRDATGLPIKLYPFTRSSIAEDAPAPVEINPRIAFGRPVITGSAVPTAVLADRFKAGDTLTDLSKDYEIPEAAIEEAIRCEFDSRRAA
jgi:uncharacterized protein (DUF433 family)